MSFVPLTLVPDRTEFAGCFVGGGEEVLNKARIRGIGNGRDTVEWNNNLLLIDYMMRSMSPASHGIELIDHTHMSRTWTVSKIREQYSNGCRCGVEHTTEFVGSQGLMGLAL